MCISLLMESLNFHLEGRELISLIILIKILILTTLQKARLPSSVRRFFSIREYNTHKDTLIITPTNAIT